MTPTSTPDQLASRMFTLVMLGVVAFVSAIVAVLALATGADGG